jgi:hypothetical protein
MKRTRLMQANSVLKKWIDMFKQYSLLQEKCMQYRYRKNAARQKRFVHHETSCPPDHIPLPLPMNAPLVIWSN